VRDACQSGQRVIALDIPLLTESPHWPRQLDAVLVVDCSEATQIARVQARSALDAAAVQAIMATQNSRAARRAAADATIYNDGLTLAQLRATVYEIAACFKL
jgi:dephospho-CoA kinase